MTRVRLIFSQLDCYTNVACRPSQHAAFLKYVLAYPCSALSVLLAEQPVLFLPIYSAVLHWRQQNAYHIIAYSSVIRNMRTQSAHILVVLRPTTAYHDYIVSAVRLLCKMRATTQKMCTSICSKYEWHITELRNERSKKSSFDQFCTGQYFFNTRAAKVRFSLTVPIA